MFQIKLMNGRKVLGTQGPYATQAAAVRAAQPIANRHPRATVKVCKVPAKRKVPAKKKKAPRKNPGEALAAKAAHVGGKLARQAGAHASAAARRAARIAGAKAARAGSSYLSETAQQLEAMKNPRRRNPLTSNVDGFLAHLRAGLVQYDMKESKKYPNIYRLGHLLGALDKIRADVRGRETMSDAASLEALKQSIGTRFILKGMPPARKTIKAIDAFLTTGKAPKYPISKGA